MTWPAWGTCVPNGEIKNNNKEKINTPGSKSYRKGEKVAGDRGRPGGRCNTRTDKASRMIIHVLPTPRKVEDGTGLAGNNSFRFFPALLGRLFKIWRRKKVRKKEREKERERKKEKKRGKGISDPFISLSTSHTPLRHYFFRIYNRSFRRRLQVL